MLDIVAIYQCMLIQGKLMKQWQKNLVSGPILAHLIQIRATIFFLNAALSVTRYHGMLSLWTISERT